jgi:SAM-dependent methyltransferase
MSEIFESIECCRLCQSKNILDVLDLGDQPPANSLYKFGETEPVPVPLRLVFCEDCSTVQLGESVDPQYLFSEYIWVTGTSTTADQYSREFAKNALAKCVASQPSVAEIASNDGTFLRRFLDSGCDVLGIDPAKNIADVATNKGVPTLAEFFTVDLAKRLVEEKGQKDIVFARNVLPHVKEILSVVEGIKTLLIEDGVGIIEFHDAGLILKELHYDSIYHEHLFLFSLKTMSQLLAKYGLYVFDIMPSPISGGSWVIYFSAKVRSKTENVLKAEQHEQETGINTYERWLEFAEQTKAHGKDLKEMVSENKGKIVAYGASARSSTLLNFCGINSDHISFIIDKNPLKHGLLTPGSNIPVISFEQGLEEIKKVDKILLLAWNFKDEIVRDLRNAGFSGEFIIPFPNKTYIV